MLSEDFVEAVDDLGKLFFGGVSDPSANSADGERANLADLFTQDRLVSLEARLSSVSGKPARGSWLVIATAITVPERSLKQARFHKS